MTKIQLTLLLTLIAVPCMVLGAGLPPPTIASVQATLESNGIRVTWQAPKDTTGIAYYRVYFSRQSIVQNEGNYDDFERTKGTETSYVFDTPPVGGSSVTFGVLAVNTDGVESEGFETEATVQLSQVQTESPTAAARSTSAAPLTTASPVPALPLLVTSVAPISATGVLVTFSGTLTAMQTTDTGAFLVVDGSGTLLQIARLTLSGSAVIVHTAPQTPGTRYAIAIAHALSDTSGRTLDPATVPPIQFLGFTPVAAPAQPVPALPRTEPPVAAPTTPANDTYVRRTIVTTPAPAPVAQPVPQEQKKQKDNLPDTGPGAIAILLTAGAGAGLWTVRRRQRAVA